MAWLNPQLRAVGGVRLDTGFGAGTRRSAASHSNRNWLSTSLMLGFTMAAALTSYMVSTKVSGERAEVEALQRKNAAITSELKALDAELRVRSRLPQLQRWNDEVLGLMPISAQQYLNVPAQLAAFGSAPDTRQQAPASAGNGLSYAIAKPQPAQQPMLQQTSASSRPTATPAPAAPKAQPAEQAAAPKPAAPRVVRDSQPVLHLASAPVDDSLSAAARTPTKPGRPAGLDTSLIAAIDRAAAEERRSGGDNPTDLLRLVSHGEPALLAGQ